MPTIANPKLIQKKSRKHEVTRAGSSTFDVLSGNSGEVYHVTVHEHGAQCQCKWSQYRPASDQRSGCSHTVAVFGFIAEENDRRVSAWSDKEQALRQKKVTQFIGDNVYLTLRKAA